MQLPAHADIHNVFKPIDTELTQVGKLIDKQLADASEPVKRLLENVNVSSGKMIRPALVLLSARCCGKITDKHIRVAAIIELIHNATLLHDDVLDEGQKRRGAPTANSIYGNESAVLLGDFLLTQVLEMGTGLEPQVTKIIAATAAKICAGEIRQINQKQNWQLTESEYIDIITEKSASLFRTSCYLGALLADTDETKMKALADFGLNAGIAFQITDDLLDIIGDENKTGKTLGSDVNKNKLTLAVIHLLKTTDEKQRSIIIDSLADAKTNQKTIVDMLQSNDSLEYAKNRAMEFVTEAIAALEDFQDNDTKNALIDMANFAANRTT